ncbi:MAG: GNAT family N-acetyltransferase [Chloroflexi bacterium]|nr:GNAT family N-acetyltransferase [Chloroflexota bacterium]
MVDDWWAERHVVDQLPRLWLRHFNGTSWLAEDGTGRLAAFLVGFISPGDPTTAVCHLVGVAPQHRRRGLGRELYERFAGDARAAGAARIVAAVWPGDPIAVKFHVGLGFEAEAGPGTQRLYGTPAYPNDDFGRLDRTMFRRPL